MRRAGKVLILGFGNPLRGDDGFGWNAAERLAALVGDPLVDIRPLHQLTPELAEPVSQVGYAIFIDASREGTPGELRIQPLQPAPAGAFTHQLTPAALLALARDLYGRAPEAVLFASAGESFEYVMELSEPLQAALGEVCTRVLSLLQEL
jgi:hydrogenase maturation protease